MKAGPLYKSPEACHGDCYVLDPDAWNRGKRVVKEVIPARNSPIKRPPKPPKPVASTTETYRACVWDKDRPYAFWFENVPVKVKEPVWAARARELRAVGWSYRRIAKELDLSVNRHLLKFCE